MIGSLVRALGDDPAGRSADRRAELAQLAYEHAVHMEGVLRQVAAVAQGIDASGVPEAPVPLHRIIAATTAVVPRDRLGVEVTPAAGNFPVPPQHTRQVLINLLDNAARHGPPEGPVRLRAVMIGRRLRLAVSDTGRLTAGLDEALHRGSPPMGMAGLGLWIVRHLVTVCGGTIAARPLPAGVAVEVTLPPPD